MTSDSVAATIVGPVGYLTIDRAESHNALSNDVLAGLRQGLQTHRDDPRVRVVVITGAGNRSFCAGGDLKAMKADRHSTSAHDARGDLMRLFQELWDLGKPTIARVNGHALAGGMGLALACDFVIAADTATFGVPEVDVGLWAFMVTIPLLQVTTPRAALDLLLTGRRLTAAEALQDRLIRHVVPSEELDRAVDDLASKLALKAPTAMRLGRTAFYAVCDSNRDLSLRYLHSMLAVAMASEDAAEGLAAFSDRRPPRWATVEDPDEGETQDTIG